MQLKPISVRWLLSLMQHFAKVKAVIKDFIITFTILEN